MSPEPRNIKQIYHCKAALNEKSQLVGTGAAQPKDQLESQKDVNSFIKPVAVTGNPYIAFVYTEKQLNDVEKFCCKVTDSTILAVDAAFSLCIMWITDTSYRNLRL